MRRIGLIVALGALLGMFGGVVTASPALADRGPKWEIVPTPDPFTLPLTLDGGELTGDCGFNVGVTVPVNREYSKLLKTPDGVVATLTTGALTASLTAHGKTITENISGPLKTTVFPDGSAVVAFKGLTLLFITRDQAQQFGLPAVSVIAGGLTVSVDPEGNTSVSLRGHVLVDVCAALS
jgi:hypothetical protein